MFCRLTNPGVLIVSLDILPILYLTFELFIKCLSIHLYCNGLIFQIFSGLLKKAIMLMS